jgi:uncharacterized membrane protein YgaE (UPF0421/DUF939 family)
MLNKIINIEYLIHSFKTLIACCIGILLTYIISFPSDQWVVITILVVMCSQLYVGSVLQKSYLRFIGTLVGCLFAIFALLTMGDNRLAVAATVGISGFIFSFISAGRENLSYACTLGAVTTAIIMLGQKPTILFASERFLEITVGLLIATLVSQFILPIHARTHLRRAQIDTLEKMRSYYISSLTKPGSHVDKLNYFALDEEIVKTLSKQRQLAMDSRRERLGVAFNQERFLQKIYCEKEILRAITFMHIAYKKIVQSAPDFANSPSLIHFNQAILNAFDSIVKALAAEKQKVSIVIPHINELVTDCHKDLYTDGFIYCAELLSNNLVQLATLAGCLSEAA